MIDVIRRVIASEGLGSAFRRTRGRIGEAVAEQLLLVRGRSTRTRPHFPILNILSTPPSPRLGGIQIHLLGRLRIERAMRPVALFTPGLLTLSQPRMHAHRVTHRAPSLALYDDAFLRAVREAVTITGARTLHFEGMFGIPTGSVLQLIDDGFDVVLTLHDFALIADDPHRPVDVESERRTLGRELLQRARAVVFPSHYLEHAHGCAGTIIPAAIPLTAPPPHGVHDRRRVAFVGNVVARKGSRLLRPIIESMQQHDLEWFVFGGGDAHVLRELRAMRDVNVYGQYAMGALPRLLAQHGIDVVLLPSTEPETYSLTLSESWVAGVPVIAFAHSAIEERVREHGGGWLVQPDRGAEGIAAELERWLRGEALPQVLVAVETANDAAHATLALYATLDAR